MSKVYINNGIYRSTTVHGQFDLLESFQHSDGHATKAGRVKINYHGKPRGIWVNPEDVNEVSIKIDTSKVEKRISERFEVLETLAEGVIEGHIRSLIVSGAPGVGKTYSLENKLSAAFMNSKLRKYTPVKGAISAIGLYALLFENSGEGEVIVLDDTDSIFSDEEAMNLLKSALDTSDKRVLSWRKDSNYLDKNDIPTSFEFKGSVVFLTNVDIEATIEKGGKIAPHMNALISRSLFLDLEIHSNHEIMVRVNQVLKNTDMADKLKLSDKQVDMIVSWMMQNTNSLRSVSLRTVIQLAGFVKTTNDWERIASVTLLKKV